MLLLHYRVLTTLFLGVLTVLLFILVEKKLCSPNVITACFHSCHVCYSVGWLRASPAGALAPGKAQVFSVEFLGSSGSKPRPRACTEAHSVETVLPKECLCA